MLTMLKRKVRLNETKISGSCTVYAVYLYPHVHSIIYWSTDMLLSGGLSIEEAYEAVRWETVFQLASLIPHDLAV